MTVSARASIALAAAAIVVGVSACRGGGATQASARIDGGHKTMPGQSQFRLEVLDGSWASLRLGYDLPLAWSVLQRAVASTAALTLTEDDVESYDWSRQILTLTPQASRMVIANVARNDEERARPEAALDQRAFVVVLSGIPLYGGVFMHPMSAMGIGFPVIYASIETGKLRLTLRPVQSVLGDYSSREPGWNGIKDPRVRAVFSNAGKLVP